MDTSNLINRTSRKGNFCGCGRGRLRRREGSCVSSGRADVVEPADNQVANSVCAELPISGGDVEEATAKVLKRKVEEVSQG